MGEESTYSVADGVISFSGGLLSNVTDDLTDGELNIWRGTFELN